MWWFSLTIYFESYFTFDIEHDEIYGSEVLITRIGLPPSCHQYIGKVRMAIVPFMNDWTGVKFTMKLPFEMLTLAIIALIEQFIVAA